MHLVTSFAESLIDEDSLAEELNRLVKESGDHNEESRFFPWREDKDLHHVGVAIRVLNCHHDKNPQARSERYKCWLAWNNLSWLLWRFCRLSETEDLSTLQNTVAPIVLPRLGHDANFDAIESPYKPNITPRGNSDDYQLQEVFQMCKTACREAFRTSEEAPLRLPQRAERCGISRLGSFDPPSPLLFTYIEQRRLRFFGDTIEVRHRSFFTGEGRKSKLVVCETVKELHAGSKLIDELNTYEWESYEHKPVKVGDDWLLLWFLRPLIRDENRPRLSLLRALRGGQ